MRRIISLAAAVAALRPELRGEEIPGENGWEVTCRLQLEVPPAFTLYHKGDLYFTAFTAAGLDGVYRIKDYHKNCNSAEPELIFNELPWPNTVDPVPDQVFGTGWFSVSAGFFPQNKNDGCIIVFHEDDPSGTMSFLTPGCHHVQGDHDPFFYHKVEWHDMDGDGDLDAVTARCINDGPITPINQTLLWIENNQNRPPNQLNPWHINEIKAPNNADVFFNVAKLPRPDGSGSQMVIAVGSFYSQTLELIWTEDPNDSWRNGDLQKSVQIDTAGWYFDVHFHDINGNGKLDLMATTWSRSDENGMSLGYELNGVNWQDPASWIRHDIFTRFPRFLNQGLGAPGGFTFGRTHTNVGGKEFIFVSGDDDGRIYRHTPSSDFVNNWRYETDTIYQLDPDIGYASIAGGTIGEIRAIDFNDDLKTDILLPNYTLKQLIILEQTDGK